MSNFVMTFAKDIYLSCCSGTIPQDSAGNVDIIVHAKMYEELCQKAGVQYTPHKIQGVPVTIDPTKEKIVKKGWWESKGWF